MSHDDAKIAAQTQLKPIQTITEQLGLNPSIVEPYGHHIGKINCWHNQFPKTNKQGKLILVTAMSPTPAGEGKTVTSIGLNDALRHIGKDSLLCLREPSLGPYFGMKGGATGGGHSQVAPANSINLHFTGDFHAISSAHNLLAAMIDNQFKWGNHLNLDPNQTYWGRVMDMNDRSLRQIVTGLGQTNGMTRESNFEITAASGIMALICLAKDEQDLKERLARIVIGRTYDNQFVKAQALSITNAMNQLLSEAIKPNLVQSLENNPVLIHGGPFANIAHGCNSVIATQTALKLGDYVVTEAGFGADLGAEKFFNLKCRQSGLEPDIATCVATVRALKMHGGVGKQDLEETDVNAVRQGLPNLGRHVVNLQQFGIPVVVAINHIDTDSTEEIKAIQDYCEQIGVKAVVAKHWAQGGEGASELAQTVVDTIDDRPAAFELLYSDNEHLSDKIRTVAQRIYGADGIDISTKAHKRLKELEEAGFGHLPVCLAKTQYSFSTDNNKLGAPTGHIVPVRDIKFANGAGFVVAICGQIMTMPGLAKQPAAMYM